MMFFHHPPGGGGRRGEKESSFVVRSDDDEGREEDDEGLERNPLEGGAPLSNSGGVPTPTPTSSVKLKLKGVLERAVSELPESPHNKVCTSYGEVFFIFLRFKGRTRLAKWTRFDTKVDLQKAFFAVFHFPESVLHAFLLNKVRLMIVPQRRLKNGRVVEEAPELFTVLS